jgi:hypothetical protein
MGDFDSDGHRASTRRHFIASAAASSILTLVALTHFPRLAIPGVNETKAPTSGDPSQSSSRKMNREGFDPGETMTGGFSRLTIFPSFRFPVSG